MRKLTFQICLETLLDIKDQESWKESLIFPDEEP